MSAMSLPSPLPAWLLAGNDFKFETVAGKIPAVHGRRFQAHPQTRESIKNPAPIVGNGRLNLTDREQSVSLFGPNVSNIFLGLEAFCRQE
jgi:hypothetical protein